MMDNTIDDVFDRFVQNADKINETWQIVEFFENEFERFKMATSNYKDDISKEQEKLKKLRIACATIQDEIKNAALELERLREDTKASIDSVNLAHIEKSGDAIKPLQKVKIVLKDGVVVKANPATNVYPQELYEQYTKILLTLKTLRARLNNSDLENARLKNEIKEMRLK